LVEVIAKIGVGVRERMSEVHLIIVSLKRVSERETVVLPHISELTGFALEVVLLVNDVSASSVPAYVLILSLVRAVAEHSHSEIVKTIWLGQI
jgi:hypothetical protein